MKCQWWVHCCTYVPRQVSLLLCQDVIVCKTCLGYNSSVEEKLEFGRDEYGKEEKFCYVGGMISCYVEASEAVGTRIVSTWKKFRELSDVLVAK